MSKIQKTISRRTSAKNAAKEVGTTEDAQSVAGAEQKHNGREIKISDKHSITHRRHNDESVDY